MKLSFPAMFAMLASLVVIAAAAAGLIIVGGPGQARVQRFDDQRIEALRLLSSAVEREHASRGALPATLVQLATDQDGIEPAVLRDPETGAPYDFRVTGLNSFELCATFTMPARVDQSIRWRHQAGRTCFPSTVTLR